MATPYPATVLSAAPAIALQELTALSPAATIQSAGELLLEYGHFVAAQPGIASFCLGALEQEAAQLPESYLHQNGGALLANQDGEPLGFVAWRSLPAPELAAAWEIKRLWVRPAGRGSGLGHTLMDAVIDRARAAGKSTILLDTAPEAMPSALRLYRQMGFVECPAYNGRAASGILYMRKQL
jgi:ribosomal protein S18 acetylase RimI-like enzyme